MQAKVAMRVNELRLASHVRVGMPSSDRL
jgi:hypothetical protein